MTGFLNTIILLGALQGFIISVLLFRRKQHTLSDRLLAALIFLMALASTNIYFTHTGWFESSTALRIIAAVVPMVIVMPMGPLILFYIKSRLDPSFKLARRHKLQFYTGIIDIVPELAAAVFVGGVYAGWINNNSRPWGLFIDTYNVYVDIPRWISLTAYLWLSLKAIKMPAATPENKNIGWLRQFISIFLAFQLIWLLYLIPYVIPAYTNKLLDTVDWYPVYIPLAVMIYWLGLKGYLMSVSFTDKKKKTGFSELPEQVIQQTRLSLTKAMEEDKLYLNPDLNLDTVGRHAGISPKIISTVLNQHERKSFTEWVNGYRVEEFKRKIAENKVEQLTLLAIASECGFNSQASFQRIFKNFVGMTPSEYLKTAV